MDRSQDNGEFWQDLAAQMEDPEFREEFLAAHARTLTIDRIVNLLEEQRQILGLSKADVARRLHTSGPWVRRLLSAKAGNPTLSTLAEVAAALGLQVTLEPVPLPQKRRGGAPRAAAEAPKHTTQRKQAQTA